MFCFLFTYLGVHTNSPLLKKQSSIIHCTWRHLWRQIFAGPNTWFFGSQTANTNFKKLDLYGKMGCANLAEFSLGDSWTGFDWSYSTKRVCFQSVWLTCILPLLSTYTNDVQQNSWSTNTRRKFSSGKVLHKLSRQIFLHYSNWRDCRSSLQNCFGCI